MNFPALTNFATLARASTAQSKFILMVATSADCQFCEELKNDFLQPLLRVKRYNAMVLVSELSIDNPQRTVVGFTGKPIRVTQLMQRYGIVGTPTMVFLGSDGTQLHDPIFGVEIADFFFYTIEHALETSHARL